MKNLKSILFKRCGIYKITCVETNKIYIGSSINIYSRWVAHLVELNKNRHDNPKLQHAYNKYGKSKFTIDIIEECNSDILLEREQYYLDFLKPFGCVGFNINEKATCGPYMGKSLTLISPTGEICSANSAHEFVGKYNLPHKAIGSLCLLRDKKKEYYMGWSHPDNIIPKRQLRGPDGKIYDILFSKTREHSKQFNLSEACLSMVLHGKQKSHRGWRLP